MLKLNNLTSLDYYLAAEFDSEEAELKWGGKDKELLDLPDAFDAVMFERLLHGRNPHDGTQLTARLRANRKMGWDVTNTEEKIISQLALVDDRIPGIVADANDYAMGRLERQIGTRVRKGGKDENRTTGNFLCASEQHWTNRLGEIHLHTHNLIPNQTWDAKERQWKAVQLGETDLGQVNRDKNRYLVKRLREIGYDAKFLGNRYTIRGIPEIDAFKERNKQVKAKQAELELLKGKPLTDKAKAKASLYDRPPKIGNGSREAMQEHWHGQLTDSDRVALNHAHLRSRGRVKQERWRQESRRAYAMRPVEIEHAPERERGRGR